MAAAGQEDEARIFPVGHGCSEPWRGKCSPCSTPGPPAWNLLPYLAGAFTTWSSAVRPRRCLSAGSSASRLRSPGRPGEMLMGQHPLSPPRTYPHPHRPLIPVPYSPRMGRPAGLFSASTAPGEGKFGQDIPPSLSPLPPSSPIAGTFPVHHGALQQPQRLLGAQQPPPPAGDGVGRGIRVGLPSATYPASHSACP